MIEDGKVVFVKQRANVRCPACGWRTSRAPKADQDYGACPRCVGLLGRMQRSPYDRRQWFTSCPRCGRTLSIEPDPNGPRGEWLITGNASRMKCATAARTYGRRKDLEQL